MSRPAIREVEFYSEGKLIKKTTDAETARTIGMYKDVYNKIQSFYVMSSSTVPVARPPFKFNRETLVVRSPRLKIECTKEYMPNVPEILNGATYSCKIQNMKTGKSETIEGGVALLYYNLFRGRKK